MILTHCVRNVNAVSKAIFQTAAAILRKWAGHEGLTEQPFICDVMHGELMNLVTVFVGSIPKLLI